MNTREFRDTVGQFATGVTVITTNVGGRLHGMTANAFASLSLDPLLVLVCVDNDATCHSQLLAASHFGVNILAADQEEMSNSFAQRLLPEPPLDGRLHGAPFEFDTLGVPRLTGCVAHLSCSVHQRLDGGDHGIFIGQVEQGEILRPDAAALLYLRGRYAATAE